ncbi:MAG: diaminopimelate epimerase [Opitutae bacterium]|nr:diaminopimelate epimerase [Opitutae bacterium]|tara:strand:+ start:446 stop:1288 length:843 start_codon:yes stop_codon:yes gene_type:complete
MKLEKYHALGNDYLVLNVDDGPERLSEEKIVRICHRNFGLGSDGILWGPFPSEKADFGLRILNPDGSEAEKSGNGLRIFARYLKDQGKVSVAPFTIDTLGGIVTCEISEDSSVIAVEMGQVSFHSDVIPVKVDGDGREILNEPIEAAGRQLRYYAATIGNPHCVVPMDEVTESFALEVGPSLENHANFPNRTNVQLMQVLDRNNVRIEIWERGAGYTLASGSSSSAAGAVARKMGACDEEITVHMPGGKIGLRIDDDFNVTMFGPATRVGTMVLDSECLD